MIPRERETIRERVRLGFNRYEIIATPVGDNDYAGAWRCPLCNRGDRSANRHPRPAAALEWARNCVDIHHAATHPEPADIA
jgi:hypothetical protein